MSLPPFEWVDFKNVPGVPCPCGTARRAFMETEDFPGSLHVTDISTSAKPHYHKEHSEVYYFLECEPDAKMELDGELFPVHTGQSVFIRPGTMHRAVGKMQVLILSMPKFDPQDEHFG